MLQNFTFNCRYRFRSAAGIPRAMALLYRVFTPLSAWRGVAPDRAGVNYCLIEGTTRIVRFVTEFMHRRFAAFLTALSANDLARKEKKA